MKNKKNNKLSQKFFQNLFPQFFLARDSKEKFKMIKKIPRLPKTKKKWKHWENVRKKKKKSKNKVKMTEKNY